MGSLKQRVIPGVTGGGHRGSETRDSSRVNKVLASDKRLEQMCEYAESNTDNPLTVGVTESKKRRLRHTLCVRTHTLMCTHTYVLSNVLHRKDKFDITKN